MLLTGRGGGGGGGGGPDKTKLNHVHLLSCWTVVGWEKGGGGLPRWHAGCRPGLPAGAAGLSVRQSARRDGLRLPLPHYEFGLSLSCRCLAGLTSSQCEYTSTSKTSLSCRCLVVVLSLSCRCLVVVLLWCDNTLTLLRWP